MAEKKKRKRLIDNFKPKETRQQETQESEPVDLYETTSLETKKPARKRPVKKESEDEKMSQGMGDLLVGATPLLAGLVSGNMGDAYDVASDALFTIEDRRYKQREKLLDNIMKREEDGVGRLYQIKDPDTGAIMYGTAEDALGRQAPFRRRPVSESEELAEKTTKAREEIQYRYGKGKQFKKGPEDRPYEYDRRKGTFKPIGEQKEISPYFKKRSDKVADDFIKETRSIRDVNQSLAEAHQLIQKKGQLPKKIAIQSIIKKVEGGRMSDQDRAYYISNVSRIQALKEAAEEEKNKDVRQRLVNEAEETLEELLRYSTKRLRGEAEQRAEAFARTPEEYEHITKKLGAGSYLLQPEGKARKGQAKKRKIDVDKLSPGEIENLSDEELDEAINAIRGSD